MPLKRGRNAAWRAQCLTRTMLPVPVPRRLRIATRESALALWQAEHIRARLVAHYPGMVVDLLGLTTQGDRILDQPLASIGGKGLFIKELEVAMDEGRADLAVHSLKDVPMEMPPGFALACITAREDPRDAFVSNRYGDARGPAAGRRGRHVEPAPRSAVARALSAPARSNRCAATSTRGCASSTRANTPRIILAAAGSEAAGFRLAHRGAAGARTTACPRRARARWRSNAAATAPNILAALAPLADFGTTLATTAERSFSRALGGSCHTPLAAYAEWEEGTLWLRGLLAARDGQDILRGDVEADVADVEAAEAIGTRTWPTTSLRAAPRASSRPDAASVRS